MVEHLLENDYIAAGWRCCFFHITCRMAENLRRRQPNFILFYKFLWDGNENEIFFGEGVKKGRRSERRGKNRG
jgi:hypothetical protein